MQGTGWALPAVAPYFPDSAVAAKELMLSPVTQPEPMHGPDNDQLFQTGAYPERDDGPQWSREQGIGRSPGQQWPHMPHVEQYNFVTSSEISWQDGSIAGHAGVRTGWALAGPGGQPRYYYGQYPDQHVPTNDPISVEVPGTVPYQSLAQVPAMEVR